MEGKSAHGRTEPASSLGYHFLWVLQLGLHKLGLVAGVCLSFSCQLATQLHGALIL